MKAERDEDANSKLKKFRRPDTAIYTPPAIRIRNSMNLQANMEKNLPNDKKENLQKCNKPRNSGIYIPPALRKSKNLPKVETNILKTNENKNPKPLSNGLGNRAGIYIPPALRKTNLGSDVDKNTVEYNKKENIPKEDKEQEVPVRHVNKNILPKNEINIWKSNTEFNKIQKKIYESLTQANNNNQIKCSDEEQEKLIRANEEINGKKQSSNNLGLLITSNDVKTKEFLEDFSHVVEAYDFPKQCQTQDLVSIINSFSYWLFYIKWVDDTHALIIFNSAFVANEVLTHTHPLLKLRPMCEASELSKYIATKNPEALAPITARPPTCPQTVRRIVSGVLGIKLRNAKEERAKEIAILNDAREKKRLNKQTEYSK